MIYEIELSMQQSLATNIPTIIAQANALYGATNPLVVPVSYECGIRPDIVDRPADQWPALIFGIYTRITEKEGEQDWAISRWPFFVQVFVQAADAGLLKQQCNKWADVLDYWVRVYGGRYLAAAPGWTLPGLTGPISPGLAISTPAQRDTDSQWMALVQADGAWRQVQNRAN